MFALIIDYMVIDDFNRPLFEVEDEFRHFFDYKHPFYRSAVESWDDYLPFVDTTSIETFDALFRFIYAAETHGAAHWHLRQQVWATHFVGTLQNKIDEYYHGHHPLRWLILHHIHPSFIERSIQVVKLPVEVIQCCLFASLWARDTETTEILLNSGGADVDGEHLCLACQFMAGDELPVARSPLAFALESGNLPAASALLERGATPGAVMADGWTVLHSAARSGRFEAVELLLENTSHTIDVHARDKSGRTAYMIAAQMDAPAVLKCLINNGASDEVDLSVDMRDNPGQIGVVQVGLCLARMLGGQVKLVPVILDLAEYWAVSSAKRSDPQGAVFGADPLVKPYLILKITGRHLRRLVFTAVSHDQGKRLHFYSVS
jgi:hypothetical protein